jgi:hypothetical protein
MLHPVAMVAFILVALVFWVPALMLLAGLWHVLELAWAAFG